MKILVTGATGTVGSEVVKALLQRGAKVRALTRKQPEPVKLSDAVETTWGDLTDPVSVTQATVGVDKLFLLIGNVADEFTQALTAYGLAKKAGLKQRHRFENPRARARARRGVQKCHGWRYEATRHAGIR